MVAESSDYRDVRSIAVRRDDVVSAYETNRTPGPRAVLRVTPPFAGRMRARLHVEVEGTDEYGTDEYEDAPRPLHLDPAVLFDGDAMPAYPEAVDTEERLRADPDVAYSIDRHHARHTDRVAAWREAAGDAIVATTELDGLRGSHQVRVLALG
ncbi:hypothetical protein BRD01_12700 [Halobacteriales archaeon QS_8_65_32]|jgi:hypothetical protein|nr:MAG: hypothetical protein BRD01_12700 [Halobacteriales archaeon QS_8_65_32]